MPDEIKGRGREGSGRGRATGAAALTRCRDDVAFDVNVSPGSRRAVPGSTCVGSVVRNQVVGGGQSRMGQPGDEWPLSGGAIGARAPSGPTIGSFPLPALPVDPAPKIPYGEIANPVLESLSILLPALNEEDGVADVLNRIPRLTLQQRGPRCRSVSRGIRLSTSATPSSSLRAGNRIERLSRTGFAISPYGIWGAGSTGSAGSGNEPMVGPLGARAPIAPPDNGHSSPGCPIRLCPPPTT